MLEAAKWGLSLFIGSLIYSRFLSSAHQFNWLRAIFLGGFVFLGLSAHEFFKSKRSKAAA